MDLKETGSVTNVLKAFNRSIKSGLSVEAAAHVFLTSPKVSADGRILVANLVAKQESPAAISFLLDIVCDNQQAASLHDHCLNLLRGMKNTYTVLYEVDARYQQLQNKMTEINLGRQSGHLSDVNFKLCCMQMLMGSLNSVKKDRGAVEPAKKQANPRQVPVN